MAHCFVFFLYIFIYSIYIFRYVTKCGKIEFLPVFDGFILFSVLYGDVDGVWYRKVDDRMG